MPSVGLTVIAWIWLGAAFITSGVIAFDIFVRGDRQSMGVMDAVYPVTALYLGPLALMLYWRWGRNTRHTRQKPRWVMIAIEVSHCGSGCTLGDVIAEVVIYALALSVAGYALFAEYIGDYVLALAFGIVFQYFAIAPMRGLGLKDGLIAAARADFISLTFFEIGLFGWMALMAFVFFSAPHHLMPNSAVYWFLMQIGMAAGFITSWPANVWLLKRGIKVPM
jgi:hypothetical protein